MEKIDKRYCPVCNIETPHFTLQGQPGMVCARCKLIHEPG